MSYQNNGYKRATKLTIKVYASGVLQSTNLLPLMESFTQNGVSYPAVTSAEIQQMSTADYTARVTAYADYVQSNYQGQYPGLAVNSEGARIYDATACPLP